MRRFLTWSASALFVLAGVLHFLKADAYKHIIPPFIPWPSAMVYVSGLAEIAGGLGLLVPSIRRMAAIGLCLLLIAVFPANIYMAIENIQVTAVPIPHWALWARLPLQGLLLWWVWAIGLRPRFGRRRAT